MGRVPPPRRPDIHSTFPLKPPVLYRCDECNREYTDMHLYEAHMDRHLYENMVRRHIINVDTLVKAVQELINTIKEERNEH